MQKQFKATENLGLLSETLQIERILLLKFITYALDNLFSMSIKLTKYLKSKHRSLLRYTHF